MGVIPCEYLDKLYSPETRGIVLPDAENHTIECSFLWTKHRNVTDRQTDGRTDRYPPASNAGNADRCKTNSHARYGCS